MRIRPFADDDIAPVAALFRDLALEFIVHESDAEGACTFLRENEEAGFAALYRAPAACLPCRRERWRYGRLHRDARQEPYVPPVRGQGWHHGQGLARGCGRWRARRRRTAGAFTVNASNYALPVYEIRLRAHRADPVRKGLYYNPMRLASKARSSARRSHRLLAQPLTGLPSTLAFTCHQSPCARRWR
jgi:hypothetical protein